MGKCGGRCGEEGGGCGGNWGKVRGCREVGEGGGTRES